MGSDKGLLQHNNISWLQLATGKLQQLQLTVVASVNAQQLTAYQSVSSNFIFVVDDPKLEVGGPLKGLLSVHQKLPAQDLFVLACDMVNITVDLMKDLCPNIANKYEAAVYQVDESIEPLCGVYTAAGLKKIKEMHALGNLKKHSMRYVLDQLNTCYVTLPAQFKTYFNNYNSPDDLRTL